MSTDINESLRCLVRELRRERGETARPPASATRDELFAEFRALVNLRPPAPLPREAEAAQDRVLQALIAEAGVTDATALPPCAADPRLTVWRGDITTLAADAIVNAANAQMLGCWVPGHFCIDNAIHTFAGVQLRRECARLMHEQGHDEPTGRAKATPAFNLPSKWVLHTVGPIVNGGEPTIRDCELLASCYLSCLEASAERGCATLAFCCISTGVFGFPQERAAHIAVDTVRTWLDEHEAGEREAGACESGTEADADSGSTAKTTPELVIFDVFTETDEALYRNIIG